MANLDDPAAVASDAKIIEEMAGYVDDFREVSEIDITRSPRFVRRTHEGMGEWFVEEFGDNVRYLYDLGKAKESEHFAVWDGQKWETSGWVMGMIAEMQRQLTEKIRLAVREMLTKGADKSTPIQEHQVEETAAKLKKAFNDEERSFFAFGKEVQGQRFKNGWLSEIKGYRRIKAAFTEFDGIETRYYLNCANGVLDLRTGELSPFTLAKELKITKQISTVWDPQALCPNTDTFFSQIFRKQTEDGRTVVDEELIAYIWRAIGYSLSGDASEEVFFICWGSGGNGKSKFLGMVRDLLEQYAVSLPIEVFLETKNQTGEAASPNMIRRRGARFTVLTEPDDNAKLAAGAVKKATGRDAVTARALFSNAIEFTPTDKLWFSVNAQPKINGLDAGMKRRLHMIPFTVTILPENIDRHLDEKLRAELPGILRKAVEGFKQWIAPVKDEETGKMVEGLRPPAAVCDATKAYFAEMDSVAKFIEDYCVCDTLQDRQNKLTNFKANKTVLYRAYERAFPDGIKAIAFSKELTKRGFHLDEQNWRHGIQVMVTNEE